MKLLKINHLLFLIFCLNFVQTIQAEPQAFCAAQSLIAQEQELMFHVKPLTPLQKIKRFLIKHKKEVGALTTVTAAFLAWKYLLNSNEQQIEPASADLGALDTQPEPKKGKPLDKKDNKLQQQKKSAKKDKPEKEQDEITESEEGFEEVVVEEPAQPAATSVQKKVVPAAASVQNKVVDGPVAAAPAKPKKPAKKPVCIKTNYGVLTVQPLSKDQIEYAEVLHQPDVISCGEYSCFNSYCELAGIDRLDKKERDAFVKAHRLCLPAKDDGHFTEAHYHHVLTTQDTYQSMLSKLAETAQVNPKSTKELEKQQLRKKNKTLLDEHEKKLAVLRKAKDQFVFFNFQSITLLNQFYGDLNTIQRLQEIPNEQERNQMFALFHTEEDFIFGGKWHSKVIHFSKNIEDFQKGITQCLGIRIHNNHFIMIKLELINEEPKVTIFDSLGYGGLESDPDVLKVLHIFTYGMPYQIGVVDEIKAIKA